MRFITFAEAKCTTPRVQGTGEMEVNCPKGLLLYMKYT